MKLALAQLKKISFPYENLEDLDLSNELNGFEDIIDSKPAKVKSIVNQYGIDYKIAFDIEIELTLEDAVTLEPININIKAQGEELFSLDPAKEDAFTITGNTLDTKEAVIMLILSEKPMSSSNSSFEDQIEEDETDEETDNINPAFASLKDLL